MQHCEGSHKDGLAHGLKNAPIKYLQDSQSSAMLDAVVAVNNANAHTKVYTDALQWHMTMN